MRVLMPSPQPLHPVSRQRNETAMPLAIAEEVPPCCAS